MTAPLIDKVEILDCADLVDPDDDAQIVAVHGGGLTGWYGPISAATATLLDRCLAPLVTGLPVADHGALYARLRRYLGIPAGTLTSWAVGALDCAIWDLDARTQDRPVADLLASGQPSDRVPAYASWLRLEISEPASTDVAAQMAGQGWLFTKWGLRRSRDLEIDRDAGRMAGAAHRIIAAVGVPAAFDALCTWDVPTTRRFAEHIDTAQVIWLEEPLASYDIALYRKLEASGPPLALGERLHLNEECGSLLSLHGLRALTIDIVGCGGLTAARRTLAAATAAGVTVYPHGRSLLPGIHLAAAFPAAVGAVEYQLPWEPRRGRLFRDPIEVRDGQVIVPSAPGLGRVPRRR